MEEYNKYGIGILSDFEIRSLYEDDLDLDLFIELNGRPLNLLIDGLPDYLNGRFQMNNVGNILVRLSKDEDNSLATIHFLKNIDLYSSVANFVLDYNNLNIRIESGEFNNILYIEKVY